MFLRERVRSTEWSIAATQLNKAFTTTHYERLLSTLVPGLVRSYNHGVSSAWPFTGRLDEVRRIKTLISEGKFGGLVLSGPRGAGKSRLAAEALRGFECREFTSVADAGELTARAEGDKLVVIADDAQLLDAASVEALVELIHSDHKAFVLATVRTEPDGPVPVPALWADAHVERLDVPPLTLDEVCRLVTAVSDHHVGVATLDQLYRTAQGNLTLIGELLVAGRSAGLSPLECEIAEHAAAGLSMDSIAERMGTTSGAVDGHMKSIYRKLGVEQIRPTWS